MEHISPILVAIVTTVIGPLIVAEVARRKNKEDHDLADEAVDQLKAEVAALREQLGSPPEATLEPAPMPSPEVCRE